MVPIPPPETSADPEACGMTVRLLDSEAESYCQSVTRALANVERDTSFFNHNRAFVGLIRTSSEFLIRQCSNLRDLQSHILGQNGSLETSDDTYEDAWLETFPGVLGKFDLSINFVQARDLVKLAMKLSAVDLRRLPDGSTLDVTPVNRDHALGIAHIASLMAFSQVPTDYSGYSPPISIPADKFDDGSDLYDQDAFLEAFKAVRDMSEIYHDCIRQAQSVTVDPETTEFQRDADLFTDCVDRTAAWFIAQCDHLVSLREALYGSGVDPQITHDEWLRTVTGLERRFSQGVTHADAGGLADTFHHMQVTDIATGQVTHMTGSFRPADTGHAMGMIMLGLGRDAFGRL